MFKSNSHQEIFDMIVAYAETMTQASVIRENEGVYCAYRGENGNKCLIGKLIPDELYSKDMEGNTVYELAEKSKLEFLNSYIGLLRSCQRCHDTNFKSLDFKNRMVRDLKILAIDYQLNYNGVQ